MMRWNEFNTIICSHYKKYGEDPGYFNWALNPVWNKFYSDEGLTISDVEEILIFLKEWKMGRVIGQKEQKYGKEELRFKIIAYAANNKQSFLFLKDKSFIELAFHDIFKTVRNEKGETIEDLIELVFSDCKHILANTMPSKILQMVNPNLFMMWDSNIIEHWGVRGDGKGYVTFLHRMKEELDELVQDYQMVHNIKENDKVQLVAMMINGLNKNTKARPLTQWMDVYNWMKYSPTGKEIFKGQSIVPLV